jgi:hypothetical protein
MMVVMMRMMSNMVWLPYHRSPQVEFILPENGRATWKVMVDGHSVIATIRFRPDAGMASEAMTETVSILFLLVFFFLSVCANLL